MRIRLAVVYALAFALAALIPLGCEKQPAAPPAPVFTVEEPPPEEPAPAVMPIARAHFDALLYDMTYRDVVAVLGRASDEIDKDYVRARSAYGRTELRMWHTWKNKDGSAVRICFVDDRLLDKVEQGLPEVPEGKE